MKGSEVVPFPVLPTTRGTRAHASPLSSQPRGQAQASPSALIPPSRPTCHVPPAPPASVLFLTTLSTLFPWGFCPCGSLCLERASPAGFTAPFALHPGLCSDAPSFASLPTTPPPHSGPLPGLVVPQCLAVPQLCSVLIPFSGSSVSPLGCELSQGRHLGLCALQCWASGGASVCICYMTRHVCLSFYHQFSQEPQGSPGHTYCPHFSHEEAEVESIHSQ